MDRVPFMPEIHWQRLLLISDMPGFRSSSDSSHIESSANDMSQHVTSVSVAMCQSVTYVQPLQRPRRESALDPPLLRVPEA